MNNQENIKSRNLTRRERADAGNCQLTDQLGRPLKDLRISVTDRCNFRCNYCMPKKVFGKDYPFLRRSELLTYEEITRCVKIFSDLGVVKVRLTGGEPLLRRDINKLVESISALNVINDIAMTTNGSLLNQTTARCLREAGLDRITVSLDSPEEQTFQKVADVNVKPDQVLAGIDAALAVGLPVKVNMVVRRGLNDKDILPMARHFHNSPVKLRFIEYMDVGSSNDWHPKEVFSADQIIKRINEQLPLRMMEPHYVGEVAQRWEYIDGGGEIGVIASVTRPFCRDCTRLRMSAEGRLYTCLFATRGTDLCSLLRAHRDDEVIRQRVTDLWHARADRYSETRNDARAPAQTIKRIEMSYIGG